MKLAEALVLRADIKKRLEQMRSRLASSALVQEGEKPPEEPQALLVELAEMVAELERLIVAINRTNAQTALPTNETLTEALAGRDVLDLEFSLLNGLLEAASSRVNRYSRTEIKLVSTVDVVALRRRLDDTAKRRRELDTLIQGANWATDLLG